MRQIRNEAVSRTRVRDVFALVGDCSHDDVEGMEVLFSPGDGGTLAFLVDTHSKLGHGAFATVYEASCSGRINDECNEVFPPTIALKIRESSEGAATRTRFGSNAMIASFARHLTGCQSPSFISGMMARASTR